MTSIEARKTEILECIRCLEKVDYEITEADKIILDDFFDKTSDFVATEILEKLGNVLANSKRSVEHNSNFVLRSKFKLNVPAVKFPNSFHEHSVLYYLEERYADKFDELGFNQLGISNPHFIPSNSNFDESFHLSYSSSHPERFFKDTTFGYGLEVDVDVRKDKKIKVYEISDKRSV